MNDIQIFNNPEFGEIRTVIIDDEPWFVGRDVCKALGYADVKAGTRKNVDDEDKRVRLVDTPSGNQNMTIINESGLYSLIFGSAALMMNGFFTGFIFHSGIILQKKKKGKV